MTTLSPDNRPQGVQALIGGRIEQWYVLEGDTVSVGDTIMRISEAKEEYLDPNILANTENQIFAKREAAVAYGEKARNLQDQLQALIENRQVKLKQNEIKIEQTRLKLVSDSMELIAAQIKEDIAVQQLQRMEELYREDIKPLTDLEAKRLSLREANAKVVSFINKMDTHRNELDNLRANREAIKTEFDDKIAKSRSDRMTALSSQFGAEGDVNKLQSQYNTYEVRQQNYYILAPINGIVTQAIQSGIGEIIKANEDIVTIMPLRYDLAIEMFIEPMDLPLLKKNQRVMVQFDGWPAIVFAGWPNNSFGTFRGKVFAIDNFISDNGKYRVLVSEDPSAGEWPQPVRVGGGANTITLLNDVSIGYEIWRQLNGFPPDYYEPADKNSDEAKTKTPLKKVK